jgi:hypothetical protein
MPSSSNEPVSLKLNITSYRAGRRSGDAFDSHSRGARFVSRLGHQAPWLKIFMEFLSPSRWMVIPWNRSRSLPPPPLKLIILPFDVTQSEIPKRLEINHLRGGLRFGDERGRVTTGRNWGESEGHCEQYVGVLISLWLFLFHICLFPAQAREFFLDVLKKLEQRSHKCVELRGEYVE